MKRNIPMYSEILKILAWHVRSQLCAHLRESPEVRNTVHLCRNHKTSLIKRSFGRRGYKGLSYNSVLSHYVNSFLWLVLFERNVVFMQVT